MLQLKQGPPHTVMTQIPLLLYGVAGIFSLPMIGVGMLQMLAGGDVVENGFLILLGLGIAFLFLEFVAQREVFIINTAAKTLLRSEKGLLRVKVQQIDLSQIEKVILEADRSRGKSRIRLYLSGPNESHLVNLPSQVYLNHAKTAELLSQTLQLPLETQQKF